ncbi:TauD/TfdA family dioxygenase [Saccharomonospora halophila]|uniref:TauD/TfdA family dioxygenase n=1 Tax=Saccharomonospora halophila TaxID=129922 RepID=UPI000375177B|nr:TauD/TfdA family dioxygenase [Saccharomonospora halophila]
MERLARRLVSAADGLIDSREWVAAVRDAWSSAPAGLRSRLAEFRSDSGRDGVLLLRNLPVDAANLPDTPNEKDSVLREATVSAATLMLVSHGLGSPVAFRAEKSGALVQNVVPVPGKEELQANSGSVRLTFHTENAFHEHRPDFVMLLCVRPDHDEIAELCTVSAHRVVARLPVSARETLATTSFVTQAPPSFGSAGGGSGRHAILSGDRDRPTMRVDEAATEPVTAAGAKAMTELSAAFEDCYRAIRLRSGDLAVVDNRAVVHGRSAFTPRYDGRDRWLQRMFVLTDLRCSREYRKDDGYILDA